MLHQNPKLTKTAQYKHQYLRMNSYILFKNRNILLYVQLEEMEIQCFMQLAADSPCAKWSQDLLKFVLPVEEQDVGVYLRK